MRVQPASLADPQVRDLLAAHHHEMVALSPPGFSFALDLSALDNPDISLFGAWEGPVLIAVGAIKRLGADQAEIKSMRTHPDHLRKGAGQAILASLLDHARAEGLRRVSLETGRTRPYEPAIRLYCRNGFAPGEAFAGYQNGPHNQCYHLDLHL